MNNDFDDEAEFWLKGPLPGIPNILQPAAHALLQSEKELKRYTADFPEALLWEPLSGLAPVGFHMRHMAGVLDRLLTYAKGQGLSELQLAYLRNEATANPQDSIPVLNEKFTNEVARYLDYFKSLSLLELEQTREVGRKKIPATVLGLLFHAAEHCQRHIGQLLVTATVIKSQNFPNKGRIM